MTRTVSSLPHHASHAFQATRVVLAPLRKPVLLLLSASWIIIAGGLAVRPLRRASPGCRHSTASYVGYRGADSPDRADCTGYARYS